MKLTSASGTSYKLDSAPIGTGGEGDVFVAYITKIAKIYKPGVVTNELENKLKIMIERPPNEAVLSQVAWPLDIVYGEDGKCAGFIMPKLNINAELGDVYKYPAVLPISVHQKIIIAQNICAVISEVHKAGYVFGDFNPRNIGLDTDTGLVSFLDTDTYHVVDPDSKETYRCNVCAPGYAAPELLVRCSDFVAKNPDASDDAYAKTTLPTFTQYTDNFALAIHVFKLLMNGYTPFGGIIESASVSQSSPGVGDTAVRRDSYCFKEGFKHQSAAIIPLEAFPKGIADLFTRAFIVGKNEPAKRPTASEWYSALDEYLKVLVTCVDNGLHQYDEKNTNCPYCEADARYAAAIANNAPKAPTLKQSTYIPPPKTASRQSPTPQATPKQSGKPPQATAQIKATPEKVQTAAGNTTKTTAKAPHRHQSTAAPKTQANQHVIVVKKTPLLSAGAEHSLAIDINGSLHTWGSNMHGQLGCGAPLLPKKMNSDVLSDVIGVSAGAFHSMAITSDYTLWGFGLNDRGQLGDGSNTSLKWPTEILMNIVAVSCGASHTLVLTKAREVYAWGNNEHGQLGDGSFNSSSTPMPIMRDVSIIAAGLYDSAAVTTDGKLYVWGYPNVASDGTTANVPVLMPGLDNVASISLGDTHGIAITTNGDLYTWGENDYGQLGNSSFDAHLDPKKIMKNMAYISAGSYHSMAISFDGNLWAWGTNDFGQLGDGTTINKPAPVAINGNVSSVAAGENHTIAITKHGHLYEWGNKPGAVLGKNKVLYPNFVMDGMMTL